MFAWLDLNTVIRLGTSFWVQTILILSLTTLILFFGKIFAWLDCFIGERATNWFDAWERVPTAPMNIQWREMVQPDPNIPIDRKRLGTITRVAPVEQWLTHFPIDYSFFYDYPIDPIEMKQALSRLIAKLPVIGGHWVKLSETTLGIDHSQPQVEMIFATTDEIPSTDYRDWSKRNWHSKFVTGCSHIFPWPSGKPTFKLSVIHYPNPNFGKREDEGKEEEQEEFHTFLAIGCTHAMTDGEGFFHLMRCLASEMRHEEYRVPIFSRDQYMLRRDEVRSFKEDAILLGKHFVSCTLPTPWVRNAVGQWPSRRWTVRGWEFTPADIKGWKNVALSGSHGDKLKEMRLSTNDVLTALFWKLRAVLNTQYEYEHPVIMSMVINTRKWLPDRFPGDGDVYMANALGFVLMAKSRRELIDSDFSEICYWVRTTVSQLRREQFEEDMSLYSHVAEEGVDNLHRYHGRWWVDPKIWGYKGRYMMDRDIMLSNLFKLDTHRCDFGRGDPAKIRFNHNEEGSIMGYMFKKGLKNGDDKILEYYGAVPQEDMAFYDSHDVTKAEQIDWDEVQRNYGGETRRWIRRWPKGRSVILDWGAICSSDPERKFWRW